MRRLALVLVLAACKKHDAQPTPPKRDAAPVAVDWARCEQRIRTLAEVEGDGARVEALIDACEVCGDWKPILDWAKPQAEGGPSRSAIEQTMTRCDAWCDPNAKQRFMGTLDEARGVTRAPWRYLGEVCKDKVSAVPDGRYLSAPYFALDRISRAVAAHGGPAADDLARFWFALPPLSVTGSGIDVPDWDGNPVAIANNMRVVTVLADKLTVCDLPRAHLAASGVQLVGKGPLYPGEPTTAAELAKAGGTYAVIAPRGMPAKQLLAMLAPLRGQMPHLVVHERGKQAAWPMVAMIPSPLDLDAHVDDKATVQDLAATIANGLRIQVKP
jgi:hypothetical protein